MATSFSSANHWAWQREFTLLLTLFSHWLKVRGLRSDVVTDTLARLNHLARWESESVTLVAARSATCNALMQSICFPSKLPAPGLAAAMLAWPCTRTWTFDEAQGGTMMLYRIQGPVRALGADQPGAKIALNPVDIEAAAMAWQQARSLALHWQTQASTPKDAADGSHQSRQSDTPREQAARHAELHLVANIPHALLNHVCIEEVVVPHISQNLAARLRQSTEQTSACLWVIDDDHFDAELETTLFFTFLNEMPKKGKKLWLALVCSAHSGQNDQAQPRHLPLQITQWAQGLGIHASQCIAINRYDGERVGVESLLDFLHTHLVAQRQSVWRQSLQKALDTLESQVYTQMQARVEQEKAQRMQEKLAFEATHSDAMGRLSQAQTIDRQTRETARSLVLIREAQLDLRAKIRDGLRKVTTRIERQTLAMQADPHCDVEHMNRTTQAWLAAAEQGFDRSSALVHANVRYLPREFKKVDAQQLVAPLVAKPPDLHIERQKLSRQRELSQARAGQWRAWTLAQAQEQLRLDRLALQSCLDSTRDAMDQWFKQVLEVLDNLRQTNARRHQDNRVRMASISDALQRLDGERMPPEQEWDRQVAKLREHMVLLRATLRDGMVSPDPNVPASVRTSVAGVQPVLPMH